MFYQFFGHQNAKEVKKIYLNDLKSHQEYYYLFDDLHGFTHESSYFPVQSKTFKWGFHQSPFARIEQLDAYQNYHDMNQFVAIPFTMYDTHAYLNKEKIRMRFHTDVPHFFCAISNGTHALFLTKDADRKMQKFFERSPILLPAGKMKAFIQKEIDVQELMHYSPKLSYEFRKYQMKNQQKAI